MRISDNLIRSMHSNSFTHLPVHLNTQLRQGVGYSSFIGAMYVSIVRLIPALVVWAIVSVVSVVARVQKRQELVATCYLGFFLFLFFFGPRVLQIPGSFSKHGEQFIGTL